LKQLICCLAYDHRKGVDGEMSDILLVDDDAKCRQELRSLLSESEYNYLRISEATTGARGLILLKQEHPSVLIFDVSLPDMDGIAFGRKAIEQSPQTHAVVLTHLKMFDTVYASINSGFSGYLLKPVSKTELYSVLGRLIQSSLMKGARDVQKQGWRSESTDPVDFGNPIDSAITYISQHFAEPISLQDVAERVYLSPSHFSRLFKAEMGVTFTEYLTQYRIQKSKILLRITSLPVEIIANNTGFSNSSYFSTTFKRLEGRTPTEYRNLFSALKTNPSE
jgi:two-component system response regulator YesN